MAESHPIQPLELWAGVECTVNRVREQYFNQLERNGHLTRLDDLDRFAELGIRALRYPILWEQIAPNGLDQADWTWADERLGRLQELGIRPIVGLVHHGSGPSHTSLVDPAFPEQLAQFAKAVAERYPWVDAYTPVNEPLTTARFSGMYGHWYPHGRDDQTFIRALLTQCRAVVLSMQAIRQINPQAQLVQTEDLGKTFSTPTLAYQANLENERRWLSFDLLCGRIDKHHPLRRYLLPSGISEAELDWFGQHPCPPDILGINHYLTSERFLDERLENYPAHTHGTNGQHSYADVEAVRVSAEGTVGPQVLLREAWDRYHLPLAITEVHLNCTREEQLRWLKEVWDAAQSLHQEGVAMRAVTVWALLGSYDWISLVTRSDGHYEPGVFDLRSNQPRATALARMMRELAAKGDYDHPVLAQPGWWRRPERLLYPPVSYPRTAVPPLRQAQKQGQDQRVQPLLITGATGTLGKAFARMCEVRGISYQLLSRHQMDIADPDSVKAVLSELNPWAIVNTAGYVRVDDAEREPERCLRENTEGPAVLAAACAQQGVELLTFSSDLVFDGNQPVPYIPYVESHAVSPLGVYGRSKAEAEARVLKALPSALVVRTSAFFGPWDEHNFVTVALRTLAAGQPFVAAQDVLISPTYVPDLVQTSLDLLLDGEYGLWHLSNTGAVSWADLAREVANYAGFDASYIRACASDELSLIAPRPRYSVLSSERGLLLPSLDNALSRYFNECQVSGAAPKKVLVS
ncbi:family 1 glycosylhydrolase [Leptolyngbya sp. FACHB-261]|uniref:family 1 glycosylhydrolase n=1 Tax=Leptolyngbya sp. FACHB-261 TaxID=2692806 RepID=UPI001685FD10|nr:family 1 glycosylhydrolase [Leptolyngbya sp. FACHB-261]MBD2104248.1 sugar nucleotide-binding protein [Leptolyngbya sp. FACHB-261]